MSKLSFAVFSLAPRAAFFSLFASYLVIFFRLMFIFLQSTNCISISEFGLAQFFHTPSGIYYLSIISILI